MQTDSPWKEILGEYFPDFTRMLFPELYAAMDWGRGFKSLDKELARLGGGGNEGTLIVDKLMSVYGRRRRMGLRAGCTSIMPGYSASI